MYFKCTKHTLAVMVNSGTPKVAMVSHSGAQNLQFPPQKCVFHCVYQWLFNNCMKYIYMFFLGGWLVVKPEPPASGRTVQASSLHTFQLNNHLKLIVLIMFTQFHPPPSNKQLNHHQLLHLLEISQPHCLVFTDFNHRKLIWVLSHLLYGDNLL